jgi:hypothetical protein
LFHIASYALNFACFRVVLNNHELSTLDNGPRRVTVPLKMKKTGGRQEAEVGDRHAFCEIAPENLEHPLNSTRSPGRSCTQHDLNSGQHPAQGMGIRHPESIWKFRLVFAARTLSVHLQCHARETDLPA